MLIYLNFLVSLFFYTILFFLQQQHESDQQSCKYTVNNYIQAVQALIHPNNNALKNLYNYKNLSQNLIHSGSKLAHLIQNVQDGELVREDDAEEQECLNALKTLHSGKIATTTGEANKKKDQYNLGQVLSDQYILLGQLNIANKVGKDVFERINNPLTIQTAMIHNFLTNTKDTLSNVALKEAHNRDLTNVTHAFGREYYQQCFKFSNQNLPKIDAAFDELLECTLEKAKPDNDPNFGNIYIDLLHFTQMKWSKKIKHDFDWMCSSVRKDEKLATSGRTKIMKYMRDTLWKKHDISSESLMNDACFPALALSLGQYSNETKEVLARLLLNTVTLILNSRLMIGSVYYSDDKAILKRVEEMNNNHLSKVVEFYQDFLEIVLPKQVEEQDEQLFATNPSKFSLSLILFTVCFKLIGGLMHRGDLSVGKKKI